MPDWNGNKVEMRTLPLNCSPTTLLLTSNSSAALCQCAAVITLGLWLGLVGKREMVEREREYEKMGRSKTRWKRRKMDRREGHRPTTSHSTLHSVHLYTYLTASTSYPANSVTSTCTATNHVFGILWLRKEYQYMP